MSSLMAVLAELALALLLYKAWDPVVCRFDLIDMS